MTAASDTLQFITVLTPVAEIISRLDALVSPVAISDTAPDIAVGATLAADVAAPADLPQHASALHDGWAVASEQFIDASSYAPTILTSTPLWVNAGERMPAGTDAVLPMDALAVANGNSEVHASVAHGEGVLLAGTDAAKGLILCRAGNRVRPIDAAVLHALAVETIPVRAPRVKILALSVRDTKADFISPMIAKAVRASGGFPEIAHAATLEAMLSRPDGDAIIVIGGTGTGKNDSAVKSLARFGNVEFHGFGISPGQTAAFGSAGGCPVLMLPGRLDAAMAVFLVVGHRLLARLTGAKENQTGLPVSLMKKVTSTIGLAEVVFVRRVAGGIEPLGNGMFPLQALMQADGWILVPAGSEGLAAGATVEMRNLP
jgi:molybdopterin biosynthesis enzyme